jgi:hypothetical protein
MISPYDELVERIRGEIPDLDQTVERALTAWAKAQEIAEEPNLMLDSVALSLHGFYSGVERLFDLIARHIDQKLPGGETWHRNLLDQMAQEQTTRPAVIGKDSFEYLDEFRRFRHLIRNVYTVNLIPDKMVNLVTTLPKLWAKLQAELLAFADFLEDMAQAGR